MGTTVSSMITGVHPPSTPSNGVTATGGVQAAANSSRQGPIFETLSRGSNGVWQQSQHGSNISDGIFSPSARPATHSIMGVHSAPSQGPGPSAHMDIQAVREQQAGPMSNVSTISQQQQEQRSVSQLQNAATVAAATSASRQQPHQGSPNAGSVHPVAQSVHSLNGAGTGAIPQGQPGLEKRGPVEFNHAISYVNKIKV